MYADTKFFVDLEGDEPLTEDLLLYAGGSASTNGVPVRLGYLEVFVPERIRRVRFADGESSGGNFDDITALRHRGYRIKSGGLVFTNSEYFSDDFPPMTRIEMSLPGSQSDDLIFQVQDGGFYFLGGQFSGTPALVQVREGVDQNGDPTNYIVAYNPKRECSRPEQARAYNPNRLVFDFTTEFPDQITMSFQYSGNFSIPDESFDETITRTYSKFVAGSGTYPTTTVVPSLNGFPQTYINVTGFETESPEESNAIVFGYRAIDCTEEREITNALGDFKPISAPCMPIKVYSAGKGSLLHSFGVIKYFTGDPGTGLAGLITDENLSGSGFLRFFPHMSPTQVGVVLHDVTLGPDNPPLEEDTKFSFFNRIFGSTAPNTNPAPVVALVPVTAMSYKGGVAIENFHTCSLEEAFFAYARDRRGITGSSQNPQNVTVRGVGDHSFGTGDIPIVRLDSKSGGVGLERMTNPLGGAYHFLTDGMSEGSAFGDITQPTSVSLS
jgi:hypothetical protein